MAIFLAALAALALAWGTCVEYSQSRQSGPVALVPTLPFAWSSSLLGTLALAVSGLVPNWLTLTALPATLVLFSTLIILIGRRRA